MRDESHDIILKWCREQGVEDESHDIILEWCREQLGRVMRIGVQDQPPCRVVDVSRTEAVPGSTWKRRDIVYAEGETWAECAEALGLEVST